MRRADRGVKVHLWSRALGSLPVLVGRVRVYSWQEDSTVVESRRGWGWPCRKTTCTQECELFFIIQITSIQTSMYFPMSMACSVHLAWKNVRLQGFCFFWLQINFEYYGRYPCDCWWVLREREEEDGEGKEELAKEKGKKKKKLSVISRRSAKSCILSTGAFCPSQTRVKS